jgi:N,N'-diacetyllegionaminate synthase
MEDVKRVTVIAEIGENHLGQMDLACRMIEEAAKAGADIVKFQSYRGADVRDDDPERDWFSRVELSDASHRELRAYAEKQGIEFLSSPFTVERARLLCENLGLRKVKIASSELLNEPLLDYVNDHADTVFLSTGMATLEEVCLAVARLNRVKTLAILHCVTQYPIEDHEANLLAIPSLAKAFPERLVGYSDHALGIEACVLAVALGARVIEKHFTLAKTLPGTDHVLSVTPDELAELVRQVRRAEVLLGDGNKAPVPRELAIRESVRHRWGRR